MSTFQRHVGVVILVSTCIVHAGWAGEPNASALTEKLQEGLRLHEQAQQIYKKLRPLSREIIEDFKAYLPTASKAYGEYEWKCYGSVTCICVDLFDKEKTKLLWTHVLYRPTMTDGERKSFRELFLGMPAKTVGKGVWFLAGKTEFRMNPSHESSESREKLESFVKAFNLEALKKL